ncbi:helicase: PROVISIONAL [Gigaspora margarita]|uniref:Helicase: PROVISIONAL n=1 Tax=Gigaspora margarita TaxID=4874 RepID=A0A8H3X3S6_GIGMA|nr:helicase: PROVISIONAL [Gigaspora margarita]
MSSWCGYTIKSGTTCAGSKGHQVWKKMYWIDHELYDRAGFDNQEELIDKKLRIPDYFLIAPVFPLYKSKVNDEI